jgi:hypothetical protein
MNGGTISGNRAVGLAINESNGRGGGVAVNTGSFTMNGGTISGNTAVGRGGGVSVGAIATQPVTFTMNGGTISGNTVSGSYTAGSLGGGVYLHDYSTFILDGGTISGNKATGNSPIDRNKGGGVYLSIFSILKFSNGIIHGSNADTSLRNSADDNNSGVYFRGDAYCEILYGIDPDWLNWEEAYNDLGWDEDYMSKVFFSGNDTIRVENGEILEPQHP